MKSNVSAIRVCSRALVFWASVVLSCFFFPLTAFAASIAFVQVNSAVPQTPQTNVLVKYTQAQTAGNLNVVAVGWNDTTATVSSVTDSSGNIYQRAVGP